MSTYTDATRKGLNRSLKALPTDALEAIQGALETEPYICVGSWVNNGVCEITDKTVGCLLAGAYMHTEYYEEAVQNEIVNHGLTAARAHKEVMYEFDMHPEHQLVEAFNLHRNDYGDVEGDLIEKLINAFDNWAGSSSKLHKYVEYGHGYSQKVLTKAGTASLLRTVKRLIAERS